MEALQIQRQPVSADLHLMNSISTKFRATIGTTIRCFCASSSSSSLPNLTTTAQEATRGPGGSRKSVLLVRGGNGRGVRAKGSSDTQLKNNWLDSLTCPFPEEKLLPNGNAQTLLHVSPTHSDSRWVIGIDPDVSGALALLKTDGSGSSAQVFDSPHVKVLVGKRIRRRLDAKSIVQLLKSFDAPVGTTAYIEQSIPFPQDGKQGWWGGGFGYGLWIGILVASGFSVIPVPSLSWKNEFKLSGSSKDDSRELASTLFPCLGSWLKRKKDHGRAEALLIAAYGKGLKLSTNSSCISEDLAS